MREYILWEHNTKIIRHDNGNDYCIKYRWANTFSGRRSPSSSRSLSSSGILCRYSASFHWLSHYLIISDHNMEGDPISVILVHKCFVCHLCISLRSARARTTYKDMRLWQGNVSSSSSSEFLTQFWKCWLKKCEFQSNEWFSDLASWILCRCWQSPPPRWFSRPPSWWLPGGF